MAKQATLWGMGNLPTQLDATPAGTGGMTMTNCAQCYKPIGKLDRITWACDIRAAVCDECFDLHVTGCSACRIWHEQDQAQLAAWQLGKDCVDELWTADDEAALLLTDPSRRMHQQWQEVGW